MWSERYKCFWLVGIFFQPVRSTTKIWVEPHIQYGISAPITETSFCEGSSGDLVKHWLFSQATVGWTLLEPASLDRELCVVSIQVFEWIPVKNTRTQQNRQTNKQEQQQRKPKQRLKQKWCLELILPCTISDPGVVHAVVLLASSYYRNWVNPFIPDIKMRILHTVFQTFLWNQ